MNYMGGKYRLLSQILPLFPERINTFVDMFAGGLDVSINVQANHIICNDINHFVISMYQAMQNIELEELLQIIHTTILDFNLSKTNRDGYVALRNRYNFLRNPIDLFLLICYGFNHQLRFNNNGDFNNPFGVNRSSYNDRIEQNLIAWYPKLRDMEFRAQNFHDLDLTHLAPGDFVYADPPYLISCGSYNDGKRGFEGWSETDDLDLFAILDDLNNRNIHFALSNVIEHKELENAPLNDWRANYNTHYLNANYANSSYQFRNRETRTVEVLITNY